MWPCESPTTLWVFPYLILDGSEAMPQSWMHSYWCSPSPRIGFLVPALSWDLRMYGAAIAAPAAIKPRRVMGSMACPFGLWPLYAAAPFRSTVRRIFENQKLRQKPKTPPSRAGFRVPGEPGVGDDDSLFRFGRLAELGRVDRNVGLHVVDLRRIPAIEPKERVFERELDPVDVTIVGVVRLYGNPADGRRSVDDQTRQQVRLGVEV